MTMPLLDRTYTALRTRAPLGRRFLPATRAAQSGKIGYILLWLIGVPIPVLLVFYLLRGCT
jgi:hypothetical protein